MELNESGLKVYMIRRWMVDDPWRLECECEVFMTVLCVLCWHN
jgi:hypothetical protein